MRQDWRVYFHKRDGMDPVVWSVDEGNQQSEMHVQWFRLEGVHAYSQSKLDAAPGEPSGWLAVYGAVARFERGGVVFTKQETD